MNAPAPSRSPTRATLRRELLALAKTRGPEKTFCPSELARTLAPTNWRPLMTAIRKAAAELIAEGCLCATQRGQEVDPAKARGPIRYSAK
jgi:hypothetical protein